MIELFIVFLLLYVSFKLKQQEKLIRAQNSIIESLNDTQKQCRHHVKKLEKLYDSIIKVKNDKTSE